MIFATTIGYTIYLSYHQIEHTIQKRDQSSHIMHAIHDLNLLVYESLINPELERIHQQWQTMSEQLEKALVKDQETAYIHEELRILEKIRQESHAIYRLFNKLSRELKTGDKSLSPLKKRLASQVQIRAKFIQFLAARFEAETQKEIVEIKLTLKWIIIVSFILLALFLLAALALLERKISNPISALHNGVMAISDGNLDHRIAHVSNDELGELSHAFDQMTSKLKNIMASRDELNQEIITRTQIEEKFRALVETTSDWIWEIDAEATFTYVSPGIKRILGYEPEELVGKMTGFDLMMPDEAEKIRKEYSTIVATSASFNAMRNVNIHVTIQLFRSA
jgi:nitrogen fixation/metabolism regulation signal transduction histidine kinase